MINPPAIIIEVPARKATTLKEAKLRAILKQAFECLYKIESLLDTVEKRLREKDTLDGIVRTLPDSDKTVMEISSHPFNYNCKDGFCGDCGCDLVDGEVRYGNEQLAYLSDGEIVPCEVILVTLIKLRIEK